MIAFAACDICGRTAMSNYELVTKCKYGPCPMVPLATDENGGREVPRPVEAQ